MDKFIRKKALSTAASGEATYTNLGKGQEGKDWTEKEKGRTNSRWKKEEKEEEKE